MTSLHKYIRSRARVARNLLAVAWLAVGCVSTDPGLEEPEKIDALSVDVQVELDSALPSMQPFALGVHSSVYDNQLHNQEVPELLSEAGIRMLRYPGGGYSDNYHWSTHSMTPWQNGNAGYLADGSDFGSYWSLIESFNGAAMITANYGSNLQGDGPGEPKEAAAWVAYCNGDPEDDTEIGEDGSGNDWETVGYWADLRASEPLDEDDGKNFLRISHPEPLGVEYWEIGNEVFGNGYYSDPGFELDLHVAYDATSRVGHSDLSPTTYGRGVVDYIQEMKRVDPSIKVGAVLVTPPEDYGWAPDWNDRVLAECADEIDFGIVHWYPADDIPSLLQAPSETIDTMFDELRASLEEYAGERADEIEITVTELGPNQAVEGGIQQEKGIFAAESYAHFIARGATNIAWLELHQTGGSFEDGMWMTVPGSFLDERSERRGPAYFGIQIVHRWIDPGDVPVRATSNRDAVGALAASLADGGASIMLINRDRELMARAEVSISGTDLGDTAMVWAYGPDGSGDHGTVEGPDAVDDLGNEFTIEVPPYTVMVVRLEPEG